MRSPAAYKYVLSLPERLVRSLAGLSGGLLREIGVVALPQSIRRTTVYQTIVEVTLRFLIEEVGQVEGVYPAEGRLAEHFLLKRGASHGIELLGILTFHASPIWVLAALADATGGGHMLIREVSQALKEEGLLDPNARFESMDHILDGLEATSAHLAKTLNLPPVDVTGLRREWAMLRNELRSISPGNVPTLERLERTWSELRQSAALQNRSVFAISSLMAVSTIAHVPANMLWLSRAARSAARRTGKILGDSILNHYSEALEEISRTGFLHYWKREFRPYLRAAAEQFAPGHESITERLIQKTSRILPRH